MTRRAVKADEQDAYSRYWRPMIFWKRGQLAAIKRRTHKRERREAREQIREREA